MQAPDKDAVPTSSAADVSLSYVSSATGEKHRKKRSKKHNQETSDNAPKDEGALEASALAGTKAKTHDKTAAVASSKDDVTSSHLSTGATEKRRKKHRRSSKASSDDAATDVSLSTSREMAAENMLRFVVAAVCLSAAASIRIDTTDGGYEEVKVSISKEVPYNETIVDDIKALFESSSKFLHRATNGRVYFKRVTIEFPISWPKRVGARPLSSSSFEESDVRIELPVGPYGDEPFTEKRMPCGGQGAFIGLTPGFLAQTRNVTTQGGGSPAYKFVHEWAHYRYGVFDEHGIPGDSRYPLLYCHGRME
ncbi:calcium-activated chloride channel regulator 2-like [Haemaphysalis longicornis]